MFKNLDINAALTSARPSSLVSRMLWLTLLSVFLAQFIATAIWYSHSKVRELEGLESASTSMALSFTSTVTFFQSLPIEYRHIVLDQLRNAGGTRYFVSFNKEEIIIEPFKSTQLKEAAIKTFKEVLAEKLPRQKVIKVEFSRPEELHILKNDILLSDLPRSWAHHTLSLEPFYPPILVVQFELDTNEWIYIAAVLPAPYMMLSDDILTTQQVWFFGFITALLLLFIFIMVRLQTKPLKRLAHAANHLSMDIDQAPLQEEGATELITATRAFNRMQLRLRRYIQDREHLFSAISHDLKTPITRLRLRVELIDDPTKEAKFTQDLDDLEMMVKGALQCVKDTDIHENIMEVDIKTLLNFIAETYNSKHERVSIRAKSIKPLQCKPLALKRCLSNLIDNGVKYGSSVFVDVKENGDYLLITIDDCGPGIPESDLTNVFEPYYRMDHTKEGHGLGLGISKNIIRGHGGELNISNVRTGGLRASISIPRVVNES